MYTWKTRLHLNLLSWNAETLWMRLSSDDLLIFYSTNFLRNSLLNKKKKERKLAIIIHFQLICIINYLFYIVSQIDVIFLK